VGGWAGDGKQGINKYCPYIENDQVSDIIHRLHFVCKTHTVPQCDPKSVQPQNRTIH